MDNAFHIGRQRDFLQARVDQAKEVLAAAVWRGPDLYMIRACEAEVTRCKSELAAVDGVTSRLPTAHSGADLPREIQWMPPGTHEIIARQSGKSIQRLVRSDQAAADRLQAQLQERRSKAARAQEDWPFLDFNLSDRDAAALVTALHWGGDDPTNGGIRAVVEWTEAGRQALLGKAYRRLAPAFYLDADGSVTGAPINMGGLVNRASFKSIVPILK